MLDFDRSPFLILWELTRACELACKHCRASAIERRNPLELTTEQCVLLLEEFKEFGKPLIVLTGGNPAQRPDLYEIVEEARTRGLPVAVTPSATPLVTAEYIERLKHAGVSRIAISLDGPDASSHDSFRGVRGSFAWSRNIVRWTHENGLPVQINTTMWKENFYRFDEMAELVASCDPVLWSVFFLVPTGRATQDMQITADEAEQVLMKMADLSLTSKFDIKSTAAPHFRRVLIQRHSKQPDDARSATLGGLRSAARVGALRSYQSVNDGKGLLFISHVGDIYPSGFLPVTAGNVKQDSVVTIYRESPLFQELRNPSNLEGKCGRCKFRGVCGGSRARAYGESGSWLAQDNLCAYMPPD